MAYIDEKEQKHTEAADNYDLAWKYSNHNNPSIGWMPGYLGLHATHYPLTNIKIFLYFKAIT